MDIAGCFVILFPKTTHAISGCGCQVDNGTHPIRRLAVPGVQTARVQLKLPSPPGSTPYFSRFRNSAAAAACAKEEFLYSELEVQCFHYLA